MTILSLLSLVLLFVVCVSFMFSTSSSKVGKVAMIGGGSFGTTMARHIGNVNRTNEVNLWIYEEDIIDEFSGMTKKLTDVINQEHVNIKYLPDFELPSNVYASHDIVQVCADADVIFFAIPHQFVHRVLKDMTSDPDLQLKEGVVLCNIGKGIGVDEQHQPQLMSDMISSYFSDKEVVVLQGANVASDVARGDFCETTIACTSLRNAYRVRSLVECPTFKVDAITQNTRSVEICGALKNVIALAAGFCDGLEVGQSTKAAVLRQGLHEMKLFCNLYNHMCEHSAAGDDDDEKLFTSLSISDKESENLLKSEGTEFNQKSENTKILAQSDTDLMTASKRSEPSRDQVDLETSQIPYCNVHVDSDRQYKDDVFLSSCGVADLIATCYGGRNRKCAEAIARRMLLEYQGMTAMTTSTADNDVKQCALSPGFTSKLWQTVEAELLSGQKLQGYTTCLDFLECLTDDSFASKMLAFGSKRSGKELSSKYGISSGELLCKEFPLLCRVYQILHGKDVRTVLKWFEYDFLASPLS
jgi:glycerol-3-phosphate dehydrogenase